MSYVTTWERRGIKEGKLEDKNDIAKTMLKKGYDSQEITEITEITGLSIEKIKELKKNKAL